MNTSTYAYLLSLVVWGKNATPGPLGGCHAAESLQWRVYRSLTDAERPEAFRARRTLKTIDMFAKLVTCRRLSAGSLGQPLP
jgi:hypothetical protein